MQSEIHSKPERRDQRLRLRIGAVGAVAGGLLTLAANIFHPREPDQLDEPEVLLAVAVDSQIWVLDHVLILVGVILFLIAFYGLTHTLRGATAVSWGRLAWGVAIIGVAVTSVFMIIEATTLVGLAEAWRGASASDGEVALGAGTTVFHLSLALSTAGSLFLFGMTPLLVGVAISSSEGYPSWLGWVGSGFGSLVVVGAFVQLFTGVTTLTGLILLPIGILAITLWIIYLGIRMWGMSSAVRI